MQIDSTSSQAASGPDTQDQQLLVFLKDLNLKVSHLQQCGNSTQVVQDLNEANINVETLI